MARFSLVGSVDYVLSSAFQCGCVGLPPVGLGASGRLCARPVFASLPAAAAFARVWSLALGRSVVVRAVPGGWSASVPVAPLLVPRSYPSRGRLAA